MKRGGAIGEALALVIRPARPLAPAAFVVRTTVTDEPHWWVFVLRDASAPRCPRSCGMRPDVQPAAVQLRFRCGRPLGLSARLGLSQHSQAIARSPPRLTAAMVSRALAFIIKGRFSRRIWDDIIDYCAVLRLDNLPYRPLGLENARLDILSEAHH